MPSSHKDSNLHKVVIVPGQGIGPECMEVTKAIIMATGADVQFIEGEDIQLGYPDAPQLLRFLGYSEKDTENRIKTILDQRGYKDYYKALIASLTEEEKALLDAEVARKEHFTLEKAATAAAVLKGALRTLDSGDEPSRNVTLRKMFEEYANLRRCVSLDPVIPAVHNGADILFVRENVEDLYAQVEHRLSRNYLQAQRHITPQGCEKIIVAAFESALKEGRKKVSGLEKPNILKITGGMFKSIFMEVAARYKEYGIESDFHIIDDGLAKIAASPLGFDVVVTTNMFGDIGSDIAAQVTGGVGFVSSNNIGKISMFETMGGTADDIARGSQKSPQGNLANPIALIDAASEMLIHIGGEKNLQGGELIKAAILTVLQKGYYTADVKPSLYQQESAKALRIAVESMRLGTKEFSQKVIDEIVELQRRKKANPTAEIKDLMDDGKLRNKMRSYRAAVTMETPGTAEWVAKLRRNLPPHSIRSHTEVQGFDIFIEDTGMETVFASAVGALSSQLKPELLSRFIEMTQIDPHSMINDQHFGSVQDIRSYIEYTSKYLSEYLSVTAEDTTLTLQQVLEKWKFDINLMERFREDFLQQNAYTANQQLAEFATISKTLIQCLYLNIVEEVSPLATQHGFKLIRLTNRGTEVYPTIGDPEIRDIHRIRMEIDTEGPLANQKDDIKVIQLAAIQLHHDIVSKGWIVTQALLNRNFIDGEGPQQGKLQKGVSKPYGVNLGQKY